MNKRLIGILGGMGPQASCELYRLIIEGSRTRYGALHNDEYPEIVIDSVPVPDGFSHPESMETVATMLEDRVKRMTTYGATMIAIACNTVCVYKNRLQSNTPIEVISTVDEVVKEVAKLHKRVVLLSSSTSLKLHLYQDALDRSGVEYVHPDDKEYGAIDAIISGVLKGEEYSILCSKLAKIADRLTKDNKTEAVLLGCTEMPLIFPKEFYLPVYSSLSILAESVLKRYYYRKDSI